MGCPDPVSVLSEWQPATSVYANLRAVLTTSMGFEGRSHVTSDFPPSEYSITAEETASLTTLPFLSLPTSCSRTLIGCFVPLYLSRGLQGSMRRSNPTVTPRCGSVLPSAPADVRSSNDVVAFRKVTLKEAHKAGRFAASYKSNPSTSKIIQLFESSYGKFKAYRLPGHEFRFGPAADTATAFLRNHSLLETGFVAVHWRSEKMHNFAHLFQTDASMDLFGDRVAFAIETASAWCRKSGGSDDESESVSTVYFGLDFAEFGTSSTKFGGEKTRMWRQLERITARLVGQGYTVLRFDPAVDYPKAAAAGNNMAVAAAELTIMSRASIVLPLVKAGLYVGTLLNEHLIPTMTANTPAQLSVCNLDAKGTPKLLQHIQHYGLPPAGRDTLFEPGLPAL